MSIVKTCGSITLSEIEDGIDVTGIIEQYYKSSSANELIGGSWTNTYPGWESGKYIWTKTITTYSDGKSTETTPICVTGDKGANGRGISSVDVYFYQSSSATELKDGSWSTTAPVWVNGKYVWSKTITTYDDGNTNETTPVCITGSKGETGEGALTVVIGNESQNIPCTETGIASSAFLINIPFAGYKGTNRVACTVSVGTLPSGVTLKTNTASTTSADGSIVLSVANGATFGGSSVLTGEITLTFTLENKSIIKKFTWTKTKDGAASIDYILEPSSLVIKKGYDNILSPSTITFSAYSRTGNVTTRTVYAGRFIISESTNGTTFTNKYSSASNESSKTYTPSSTNVKAIRCILYASGGTTTQLDMQTVVILTDVDNIDGELDTIRTSISGVESKVDAVEKSITDKVWQDDITTSINNYDSTTTESIRSRVSQVEQDVDGIKSTVSDVQTTLTEKADGSTVSELTEKVSNLEQDADGFKQTVSSTYVTKGELSNQSTTLRSEITQTADEIKQRLTDDEGNITSITERIGSVETEISDAKGSSTTLKVRLEGIDTSVVDAEANAKSFATQEAERIQSVVQNNINNVESNFIQRADSIEERVETNEGAITSHEISIGNISGKVQDNVGNITQMQQTLNGLDVEIQNARGDKTTLSAKIGEISQNVSNVEGKYSSLSSTVNGVAINVGSLQDLINKSFEFTDEGLIIKSSGTSNSNISLKLGNDRISFLDGTNEVAYISNNKLHITSASIVDSMQIGGFAFMPMPNGSLSFNKI